MLRALSPFLTGLFSVFRSRAALHLEILALRHQIGVLRRSACRARPAFVQRSIELYANVTHSNDYDRERDAERLRRGLL